MSRWKNSPDLRSPELRRLDADRDAVLPGLLDGSRRVEDIAAAYGMPAHRAQRWYERVATPEQRRAARAAKCVRAAAPRTLPVGSERVHRITGTPVLMEKIRDVGPSHEQWVPKRRAVWERSNGPLPPNVRVVPVGDPDDYSPGNLECVTHAEWLDRKRTDPEFRAKRRAASSAARLLRSEAEAKLVAKRRRAARARHNASRRLARRFAAEARRRREIDERNSVTDLWDCASCYETADLGPRPARCPKCGGHVFACRRGAARPPAADHRSGLAAFLEKLERVA